MKKVHYFLLSVMFVIALCSSGFAGHGKEGCGKKYGDLEEKFFYKAHFIIQNGKALDLSDEQVKDIIRLKMETKKLLISAKADADVLWIDVISQLYEDKPDSEVIDALVEQKYQIKKARTKALIDSYLKLKGTLSEDQMKELKDIWMSGGK